MKALITLILLCLPFIGIPVCQGLGIALPLLPACVLSALVMLAATFVAYATATRIIYRRPSGYVRSVRFHTRR
jgi:hypothetical protein